MKAVCFSGRQKVTVDSVPEPTLIVPTDAIVRVSSTAICGSDLHLYNGYNPTMKEGDILGHEFMGEVVEVGSEVKRLRVGDRVVVPFNIGCGSCYFCNRDEWSACENSNPNAADLAAVTGYPGAGLFGYSHLYGGYAGGQAEYVRVPFADVGPLVIEEDVTDEQVLFLGDILSTGYMAAENCNIRPGGTVAIWGAGPVGLMSALCAKLFGAAQVINIDRVPERLDLAARGAGSMTINYEENDDVVEALKELTGGRGPDAVIDAVGMEAHGTGLEGFYDRAKHALRLQTDRPTALREAIQACRPGGTVSIPGVYSGMSDKFPIGIAFGKGLTFKMGQTHTHKYMAHLLRHIVRGDIDPSFIVTHRLSLDEAPHAYEEFNDKQDGCIKVVMKPAA
ncbi:MAG: glutathione-dependent formaldehyde dehydrogenase [Cytophagaceae bacterium]|nr:glutathione-dependent formaldehyde dehydrogenase [Gemmatimonadaceae bacterium]